MPVVPLSKSTPGVEENGDFLVFYVQSSRPGHEPHRVDLQKFCGNGDCDCENFSLATVVEIKGRKVTKRFALTKGAMPSPSLECKHIRRAKRYLLFKVLNRLISDRESQANANRQKAPQARPVGNHVQRPARAASPVRPRSQERTFRSGERTPFAKAQAAVKEPVRPADEQRSASDADGPAHEDCPV